MSDELPVPQSEGPADVRGPDPQPLRWWGLGDVWIALSLYLFFAFVGAAIVLGVPDTPDAQAWALVASVALPWLGLAGWPILATRMKGAGPVLDLRLRASPRDLGFGAAMGFAGFVLAGVVALAIEQLTGDPLESSVGQLADDLSQASPWPVVTLALMAGLGAPIVEEIAFRGLLYGSLEKRGRPVLACVVMSAVVFGAFHLEPMRFPVLLTIGLVLGFVRARTASTGASMAAHVANNLPGAIALVALAFG